MIEVSNTEFEKLLEEAIKAVPEPYKSRLENIAFLIEDEPSPTQRLKLNLYPNETLFGLYEGVPLPQRGGMTKVLPDKITVFKRPIETVSQNITELKEMLNHTIWHEVAHYFGLNHERIHQIENKHKQN